MRWLKKPDSSSRVVESKLKEKGIKRIHKQLVASIVRISSRRIFFNLIERVRECCYVCITYIRVEESKIQYNGLFLQGWFG